jgi:hypothetical protein
MNTLSMQLTIQSLLHDAITQFLQSYNLTVAEWPFSAMWYLFRLSLAEMYSIDICAIINLL